jgi:uncharacterized protein YeaO (DUF488 family)
MPIKTKRWDDPIDSDDGYRLLVCRYRPRGVSREAAPDFETNFVSENSRQEPGDSR